MITTSFSAPIEGTEPHFRPLQVSAFIAFWTVCALTGGSSRSDAPHLLLLRVVTIVCLFAFFAVQTRPQLRTVRAPLLLLGAFAIVIAIQLVPLPFGLWQKLPGRTPFVDTLTAIGAGTAWLPISVAPDLTWDSLVSLLVPLTALLGYSVIGSKARALTLSALLVTGIVSVVLGAAQAVLGDGLQLYEHADKGFAIGLFANKNHEGVFLVSLFPALRAWAISAQWQNARMRGFVSVMLGIVLAVAVLVTGSRAGLLLLPVGMLSVLLVERQSWLSGRLTPRILVSAVVVIVLAGLCAYAILMSGRAVAVGRLFGSGVSGDARFRNAPTVVDALWAAFPVGWGFGSFGPVFNMFEPDRLLKLTYFNNAHNDLLELILVGGLPAALVLIVFLRWVVTAGRRVFDIAGVEPHGRDIARTKAERAQAQAAIFMIGFTLIGSLVDYPLRTPLYGAIFLIMCAWLSTGSDQGGAPNPRRSSCISLK
jgi:O-antigen ligase